MGTRADFYVGRGAEAEWLGSIAWDGYPDGIGTTVLGATTEAQYREAVSAFLAREDGTTPDMGWPWPWDDSNTTDYAYAFDADRVWACGFGSGWFRPFVDDEPEDSGHQEFPNMTERKAVTYGKRSGVMIFGLGGA